MQQANRIKCPTQEKRYTFAERHNHFPLLDPGLCKDLSFWFKHSSNCYQMCMSGPWMHWQPLIGTTSPDPLPQAWGPSVPAQPRCACSSGQWPTCWPGFLPCLGLVSSLWTCLPLWAPSAAKPGQPCSGLWGGPLPCQPCHPPVPLCSLAAKRKCSPFPFQTQMGATNLYLTYKLVRPYCRGFECFRLDMDKRNETKLRLNIQL